MATWTLADIRQKVRQITGRLSISELSNTLLDDYINKYYVFEFPAEVKLERKYSFYEFNTAANQQVYELPNSNFTNLVPPATVNNLSLEYYQDSADFDRNNPEQYSQLTPWTGDGATVNFTTTLTPLFVLAGTLLITDNVEILQDVNTTWTSSNVNLSANNGGTGTVNYVTGAVNVTFGTAPADGQLIYLNWVAFNPGRPIAVLNFDNQLKFFPVPDTVYKFKIRGYQIVSELTTATDTPDLEEWGPAIAYGAARKIVSDFGEFDLYKMISELYKEQIAYVLRRTHQNLENTRAAPNF